MGFWAKSESLTIAAEPPEEVPVPVAKSPRPRMNAAERAEYERVAASIGLDDCPALLSDQIKAFLAEENIHLFDGDAVAQYLNDQFPDGWEWRGVRDKDVERLDGWSTTMSDTKISFSHRRYTRAIPLPVLLTMQKVLQKFPDVYFYVSEPKESDGDPFLLLTDRDLPTLIIERWDEPSFRER